VAIGLALLFGRRSSKESAARPNQLASRDTTAVHADPGKRERALGQRAFGPSAFGPHLAPHLNQIIAKKNFINHIVI
jgi:hypothetical protein